MSAVVIREQFPQVKYIYNHDIMNCTAEGVVGNHLYSGRALGLSEPEDIIQLHPLLKKDWANISAHYQRIGLSHSQQVVWSLDLEQLGAHIGHVPSVFYFGPNEYTFWGDAEWLETVEYINSKNNFMSLAQELNIDVPATHCFSDVDEVRTNELDLFEYPCYLKAAISVSGVGIYRCEDKEELLAALDNFETDVPVQVQEEVVTDIFLNLQYLVEGDSLIRLACSEQVLDGFVHQGNRVPATHEPWKAVEPMAEWLKENGIKGIFAFDVAVVQTDRGLRFVAIECNPRFNGASYPTLIANKLGISEWSSLTLNTTARDLLSIDLSDIEYDAMTGEGVIIVNWGIVSKGKLMVLIAGSREYQDAALAELLTRL